MFSCRLTKHCVSSLVGKTHVLLAPHVVKSTPVSSFNFGRMRESRFSQSSVICSPDSFTSRMKSVVTPVVQVSSQLEIYSTASHFTYISQSHKIAIPAHQYTIYVQSVTSLVEILKVHNLEIKPNTSASWPTVSRGINSGNVSSLSLLLYASLN